MITTATTTTTKKGKRKTITNDHIQKVAKQRRDDRLIKNIINNSTMSYDEFDALTTIMIPIDHVIYYMYQWAIHTQDKTETMYILYRGLISSIRTNNSRYFTRFMELFGPHNTSKIHVLIQLEKIFKNEETREKILQDAPIKTAHALDEYAHVLVYNMIKNNHSKPFITAYLKNIYSYFPNYFILGYLTYRVRREANSVYNSTLSCMVETKSVETQKGNHSETVNDKQKPYINSMSNTTHRSLISHTDDIMSRCTLEYIAEKI